MALMDGKEGDSEERGDNITDSAPESLQNVKCLYSGKNYAGAIQAAELLLPHCNNPRLLSEVHLLLAKCYKGLGDLKTCITSCNVSIQHYSKWKEPFLYRSACFQALHTSYLETDGDTEDNINKDRENADILVDPGAEPYLGEDPTTEEEERRAKLRLFRQDTEEPKRKRRVVSRIDEALRMAKEGDTIFVEKGVYKVSAGASKELSSYFVLGKNLSLIGASTKDCVLLYRKEDEESQGSKLETFLICSTQSAVHSLIKRLTFRNENPSTVKTKFFGVAGGKVQFEDCVFDGLEKSEVDAVYVNSRICGSLASNYPAPSVCLRFCVFDHCQSFGALTLLHALGTVSCCYFTGVGRKAIVCLDSAKVSVENCEFAQSEETETCVSCTESDLTVTGCYIQGIQIGQGREGCQSQAIGVMVKSVARIENSYIYRTGSGVYSSNSEIVCARNLVYSCSRRYTQPSSPSSSSSSSSLGLHSGISVRGRSKACLQENMVKHCDVGLHLTESSMPAVKDNLIDSCFFSGMFIECGARPNIVSNTFCGGESGAQVPRGLGLLLILESGGLVARNKFHHYQVSPIMVFSQCHPMLQGNLYDKVTLDEKKQADLESWVLSQFSSECKEDSHFYMVESSTKEAALSDVIFRGLPQLSS